MEVDMARLLSGGDADPARAVQNLATGQTLEAARHYRALAIARPDDAAFENISAILARRVAQRCRKQELDGMPCTGEQQP